MRLSLFTHSAQATQTLGERLGARLFPGAVVALTGEMGAGKTAFIRGVCRGAGCQTNASSPSYALMHRYEGPCPVCHFDLFRVDGGDPWMAMEVEEAMDGRNIVLIEWPGPVAETLSPERLDIEIHTGSDEESREFLLSGDDRIWKERLEGLLS